jgi:hypothetical protein
MNTLKHWALGILAMIVLIVGYSLLNEIDFHFTDADYGVQTNR